MVGTVSIYLPTLDTGGAEKMLIRLAGGISDRGYDVDLVVGNLAEEISHTIPDGVRLVDLKAGRIAKTLVPLARYLHITEPDSLLSTINSANIIAIAAAHLSMTDTGVVVRMPNTRFSELNECASTTEKVVAALVPRVYPYADRIVAISEGSKRDALDAIPRLSKQDITVIHNPVIDEGITEQRSEQVEHDWFGGDSKLILAAGRLVKEKDFDTLLRAFKRVRAQRDVRLVILGEGPKRAALELLAEELKIDDFVDMPGFVDNPYKYMASTDVFALSSLSEGFGNVIVEAMACGATVVSTDCPHGPGEILENGKYGLLVPVGNPDSLASGLDWALDNPLPESILEARARDFTLKRSVDMYIDILDEATPS